MRTDDRKQLDAFIEKMRDPLWFVQRLTIQTKDGRTRRMSPLFDEQRECVSAFETSNNILVEKPRQIGSTTIWVSLFFWHMLTCGSSYNVLAIMHEYASVSRFTRQVRQHIEFLPPQLRPRLVLENTKEVRIRVGRYESSFCTTMAGGRGQGRSFTFRGVLFSEAGLYPRGSSAQGGNQGIDEQVYASITSTMPTPDVDPLTRQVVESTCGPPTGLFYNLVRRVQDPKVGAGWSFLFFPWFRFKQYRMEMDPREPLAPDELALLKKYAPEGMTRENLAFRRYLIHTKGYSERMFRQEYPSAWDEPFMLVASMWFNLEKIAALQGKIKSGFQVDGLRRFEPFKPGHTYYIGVDAAGGTGGDSAVATVLRDDGVVAAVWSANNVAPRAQAEQVARLSGEYGNAIANVEVGNVWGRAVWTRCRELGVPLWVDQNGREFVTDPRTKAAVMDWMKHVIELGFLTANDGVLLEECRHVREQNNGGIEADVGYHDDHVMSCALALWAARATITARWRTEGRTGTMGGTVDLAVERAELEKRMEGRRWRT